MALAVIGCNCERCDALLACARVLHASSSSGSRRPFACTSNLDERAVGHRKPVLERSLIGRPRALASHAGALLKGTSAGTVPAAGATAFLLKAGSLDWTA